MALAQWTRRENLLGTGVTVTVFCEPEQLEHANRAGKEAFLWASSFEQRYSRFVQRNELSALNEQLGKWVPVSQELFALLQLGHDAWAQSEGAFDLSVKTVLEGWGYNGNYSLKETVPGRMGSFELMEGNRVRLSAEVELGGLGKGYTVDHMAAFLSDFENLCIDAGGDLWVRGQGGGHPWKIVFEHPMDVAKGIGSVELSGKALGLGCSSPSRRRWRNRHHLVNPKNASPAQEMLAVYTQAENVLKADIWSTALFVMGFESAQAGLEKELWPVEALLVGPSGQIFKTKKFQGTLFV